MATLVGSRVHESRITEESHGRSEYQTTTLEPRPVIEQAGNQKLLAISIFAEVYLVDDKTIRKAPRSHSEDDMEPIIREATIYKMMDSYFLGTSQGRTLLTLSTIQNTTSLTFV
ncbi:hypothetical protein N7505_005244 [Penicillium chrysogenum]|uniref:Uncharacterized protein n=1 Tax=Penicillium chrysogenum TaxID=5076 RepID=A0ABQ8WKA6_PENCH|nr:hypothetical protein N7524_007216 [Penicillium chrysogenum]KAJ5269486.1 hypothetical protein N7505_005244 [Penicillium chrysogenum]